MKQERFEYIIEQTTSWPGGPPTRQPTDEEIQAVSALVKQESLQLEAFDNELSRLKTLVRGLEKERASLAWLMEAHRAYISPARRIPDDIVREIMIRCIPTDPPSHADPESGPALLAHIYSHWRTTAFSTPQIWSSLCVHFRLQGPRLNPWDPNFEIPPVQLYSPHSDSNRDERPLSLWQKDVDIMRFWLRHSGACPLTLSFGYIPNFSDVPCINDFFKFLIETSPRWRGIDLIPTSDNSVTLPRSFRSAVACQRSPQLQSIRFPIIDLNHPTAQELSWTSSEILRSLKLRRLTCDRQTESFSSGIHGASQCNSPLSSLPLGDWGKMTTLCLSCTNSHEVEDCIAVLAMHIGSPLEVFTLKLTTDERWPPIASYSGGQKLDIKSFPRLHILDLNIPHDFMQKIFRMIAASSLEDISIQMSTVFRITPDSIAADLLQFFEQSNLIGPGGAGVHTLKLDPIHYTRKTLYHILKAFSGVRRLVFKTEHDSSLSSLRHPNVRQEEIWAQRDVHAILNRDSNIDDEFLLRLASQDRRDDSVNTEPPRTVPLLPQLVDFTCFARTGFSPNTFTQFLRARHQQSAENNVSRLQVLRLIEVTEDYVGESSLLPKNVVGDVWLPFRQQGLTAAIINIHRPEGKKVYTES